MTERLAMTETIARACGWETEIRDGQFIEVTDANVIPFEFSFDPFTSEDHWFRAFDAMGLRELLCVRVAGPPEEWVVALGSRAGDPDGPESRHPDRMTAMGEALYQAALAKLGEVVG